MEKKKGVFNPKKLLAASREAAVNTALALCSFMMCQTPVFGLSVPLSVSLAAASEGKAAVFTALGGAAGALFISGAKRTEVFALLAGTVMLKLLLSSVKAFKSRTAVMTCAVFAMGLVTDAARLAANGFSADRAIICFSETVLCAGAVPVFINTLFALKRGIGTFSPDRALAASCSVSACVLLACADAVNIFGFHPFCAAGIFAVIVFGFLGGGTAGAAAGACVSAALAASGTPLILCLSLPVSGLAAGAFGEKRKYPCIICCTCIFVCFALLDATLAGAMFFAEGAAALGVFAAVPSKPMFILRSRLTSPGSERTPAGVSETLRKTAAAVESAARCISKVSDGMENLSPDPVSLAVMRIKERVCCDCPLSESCYCPDNGDLERAAAEALRAGETHISDFRRDFAENCPCTESIVKVCGGIFQGVYLSSALEAHNTRTRELTCGLFSTVSLLLAELSHLTAQNEKELNEAERLTARTLAGAGIQPLSIKAAAPADGAVRLEITAHLPSKMPPGKLGRLLGGTLGIEFCDPEVEETAAGTKMIFEREPVFALRLGSASRSADSGGLCGDNFRTFSNGSVAYIVLSDGMGTGGRAAVDAAMTVDIFTRLIKAGASPGTALAVAGTALNVRGGEEASATLDVAEINLFTGEAVIYKAGAAPSYCTRKGSVRSLDAASMPLGILAGTGFKALKAELFEGDILLMVSDGVSSGNSRLENALKNAAPVENAGDFAEKLLEDSLRFSRGRPDDMTVIAAVLSRAEVKNKRNLLAVSGK